jgi:hypothetical protein
MPKRASFWLAGSSLCRRSTGAGQLIFLVGYLFIYRPQQLRWRATEQEVARAMPGDQIQPHPVFNTTRAITIDARDERRSSADE